MKRNDFTTHLAMILLFCTVLASCNHSDNQEVNGGDAQARNIVPVTSSKELGDYLKAGLELYSQIVVAPPQPEPVTDNLSPDSTEGGGVATNSQTSSTNLVVSGVDEADFVKNDDQYLYFRHGNGSGIAIQKMIEIPAQTMKVGDIDLGAGSHVQNLYLHTSDAAGDQLIALGGQYSDPAWPQGSSSLWFYNVDDPYHPKKQSQLKISGYIYGSRRIGDTLHLITQSSVQIPEGFVVYPQTEQERASNLEIINSIDTQSLLPKLQINDDPVGALVNTENCFIPSHEQRNNPYPVITTISSINLNNPREIHSTCFAGRVDNLYASTKAIYFTTLDYYSSIQDISLKDTPTIIQKFSFSGAGVSYRGSGLVKGYCGSDSFRMDEYNDYLRVVTTDYSEGIHHTLTILKESTAGEPALETVSTLPNEKRPDPIGKPNEFLYGARFIGDRAYLVTFRQTDPLYSLDLSDPEDPKIAGELQIPGFSTYLHPVDKNLLLGFGRETGFSSGLKISLFDVEDSQHPKELSNITIGGPGTWSNLYDHHSLTYLDGDPYRFALPVIASWQSAELHLFEIDKNKRELTHKGAITGSSEDAPATGWGPYYLGRSILQGGAIHYLRGNKILSAPWQSLGPVYVQTDPAMYYEMLCCVTDTVVAY